MLTWLTKKKMQLSSYTKESLQSVLDKHVFKKDVLKEIGLDPDKSQHYKAFNRRIVELGCKWTSRKKKENLIWTTPIETLRGYLKTSSSVAHVLTRMGVGYSTTYYQEFRLRCKESDIDLKCLGEKTNESGLMRRVYPLEAILVENSTYRNSQGLKKKLIKAGLTEDQCAKCGIRNEWKDSPLTLQLDHINGISTDNRLKNLRVLCPNCHSQTDTFTGRNTAAAKKKPVRLRFPSLLTDPEPTAKKEPVKLRFLTLTTEQEKQGEMCGLEEPQNRCEMCEMPIEKSSTHCVSCAGKKRMKFTVSVDELRRLVHDECIPFTQIGKKYGVSDNAIRKRCKKLGIEVPKRGRGFFTKKK